MLTVAGVGGSLLRARPDGVRLIKLNLPPLDEQRRIAAILDQADDLRRKRRETLGLLDKLGQAWLQALQPNTHDYHPLIELCRRVTDGTHQAPEWAENGVPFLFVSNIRNQSISMETSKFVSEMTFFDLTRRTPIEIGDVLYTAVGSYGFSATVRTEEKFIFQRHVAHIKPKHELIDSTFLSYLLESVDLRHHADKVAVGLAQKTVTLEELKKFPIPLPPLPLQRAFAARVAEIDKLKAHHRAHLARLDALFASLQHRAFRGDLPAPKGDPSPRDSFSHREKVAPRSGVG
jgi:type I restriction enzyme S subunit